MFEEFVKKLSAEISKDLPGFSAQKLMAPLGRRPPEEYVGGKISPKMSAVLILLYPNSEPFEIRTVFIHRPDNEGGSHAGQIAFPGGGADEGDKDLSETALREAEEEIGVERGTVKLLGGLTPLYIPVSNYMVHPFIGITDTAPSFNPHPEEVQGLLEVSIDELLTERNRGSVERFVKVKNLKMQVPCYDFQGKIIWGATAMIVSEFTELLARARR